MSSSKTKIAALSIALMGATCVHAEIGADSGMTLGFDAGRASAHKSCDRLVDCDNSDTSARLNIGYDINSIWSAELGYTSFGTLFKARNNNVNASQKASAWTLSGIAMLRLNESFGVYGRAGLARYSTDNSGTVEGIPVKDQNDAKPYFGVGLNFEATQDLSIHTEYQHYTDISGVDGSKDDVQSLYAGVVYHF